MLRVLENSDVWIAADSGHVVGFCLLEPDPGMVWLESLAIDPAHQGRGLGQVLAHRALEAADIRPERPAALEVSSVNQAAIKVYQRLGFELRRERRRYKRASRPVDRLYGTASPSIERNVGLAPC